MGKRKSDNTTEVEVEYIPEAMGTVAPFLGYFPSGYNPTRKKNRKRPHEVDVYRHDLYSSRMQLVVSPEGSNVDYVGKNYAGEAAAGPHLCTYLLGVFDKEKQTLKVVPVAGNKIFRLEARVKGVKYMDNELLEEAGHDPVTKENNRDRKEELTNLYGSKKNRILVKKHQALVQQQNDPLSQQYVDGQLKDFTVNEEPEVLSEVIANLPPHDPTATVPEKVFFLDKIILKVEWPHLRDVYELLESDSPVSTFQGNGYPIFVVNRMSKIKDLKDQEEKKKQAGILSFITHLVNFFHLSSEKGFKSKVRYGSYFGNIPYIISQRLLGLFVNPESGKVSNDKRSLIIYYILVLTLFVDEFSTSPKDIATDLKMPEFDTRFYWLQLGCKFERSGDRYVTSLAFPLNMGNLGQRRRKNRGQRSRRR